jgi:hypothetical protein
VWYFVIEETIVVVRITVDLLQRTLYIGDACRVHLIVAAVEKAVVSESLALSNLSNSSLIGR